MSRLDLVIDTSALIAVIANESQKQTLIQRTVGATLYAPGSVPWEIGNAFSAMLKRRRITLKQAEKAIAVFCQIPIRYIDVSVSEALAYSELFGLYAYDAYMIVAAKQQRCPLLTLDQALMHAAKTAGVGVVEV